MNLICAYVAQINDNLFLINTHATSILHILLFQEAIHVTIVEFPIEEFIFDHSLRVHFFIDGYLCVKEEYASCKIFFKGNA